MGPTRRCTKSGTFSQAWTSFNGATSEDTETRGWCFGHVVRRESRAQSLEPKARSVELPVGRALVVIGLAIAGLGLLMMFGLPLFRLPGDIYIRRGSFSFYFPLATSILLSIILTLIFALFRR